MKNNRPFRILTVTMALAMMTGYVVYSQREQIHSFAPGSKAGVLSGPNQKPDLMAVPLPNQAAAGPSTVFAPGSKSIAPLIHVTNPASAQPTNANLLQRRRIAPGSKSAPVFDFRPEQSGVQAPAQKTTPRSSTNLTSNLKS
jgi:hypothetical protein